MSKFKVGDWVRRISNGEQRQVSDVDMPDGTFYSSAENLWYFQREFELVSPPQPAESPDDWVTQDVVRARPGIDERAYRYDTYPNAMLQWDDAEAIRWDHMPVHGERGNGFIVHLRCRRRDYPQKPIEVHTGGPYVARSVHERVCGERDDALAQAARIRDEAVKLAAERDQLKADQESLLADLKNFEETTAALNKRVLGGNPNGWPLVPVDPLCIPDGHRAVEVTCSTQHKWVASYSNQARLFMSNDEYPRLVVEPIPTPPAPEALPRPEFPAWIRAGWWVAMDNDDDWFAYNNEPEILEGLNQWKSGNPFFITADQKTPSMKAVPTNRWREAKWQIE